MQVGAGQGARGSSDDLRLVEVGVRCSLEQMLEQGGLWLCAAQHSTARSVLLKGSMVRLAAWVGSGRWAAIQPAASRGCCTPLLGAAFANLAPSLKGNPPPPPPPRRLLPR